MKLHKLLILLVLTTLLTGCGQRWMENVAQMENELREARYWNKKSSEELTGRYGEYGISDLTSFTAIRGGLIFNQKPDRYLVVFFEQSHDASNQMLEELKLYLQDEKALPLYTVNLTHEAKNKQTTRYDNLIFSVPTVIEVQKVDDEKREVSRITGTVTKDILPLREEKR